MKISLRIRFFLWLLALLVIFILVQAVVYSLVELATLARNPGWSLASQLFEVVLGVGLDLLLLPLLAAAAWWISSRMLQPLRQLAHTAEQIKAGQLEQRMDLQRMPDDETRTLAEILNSAFDRYQEALERLERFASDASHQLRTPLTAIRSTAEVTLSKDRDKETYREGLSSVLEEVAKLSHLVDQLLRMARLDATAQRDAFVEVDLDALLQSVVALYRPACDRLGIALQGEARTGARLRGNPELLREAVQNVLDNAVRFAGEGGRIRIVSDRRDKTVAITVMDSGPGVPPAYAETIFERFRQGPHTSPQGSGVGLAFVREVLRMHGGAIRLAPTTAYPSWGAAFVATLPTA
jgi:signal transduction histidine kinase